MDTETFLLERDALRLRLAEHRLAVEVLHEDGTDARFMGMGVRDWAGLLMNGLPGHGAWRWLPKGLLSFAAPVAIGLLRRKGRGWFSGGSSMLRLVNQILPSKYRI